MENYYFNEKLSYIYRQTEKPLYNETGLHSHELYEILYFESGEGELVLEDKKLLIFPSALLFIPPHTEHCINLISDKTYSRSVINFENLPDFAKGLFEKPTVITAMQNSRIISLFSRMKDYDSLFSGSHKEIIIKTLVTELLLVALKTVRPESKSYGKIMSEAVIYIENNLAEIKNVNELCDALCLSRAGLYREFRAETGKSPMQYITEKRLERAQNLIRLGENPTKVCYRTGFGDYSAFYRAYKTYFGYSPTKTKQY